MNSKIYIKSLIVAVGLVLASCDDLLEDQKPQNSVEPEQVFADATGARAALVGAYDILQSANYMGTRFLILPDLHGGNLSHTGTFPSFAQFANRAILTDNAEVTNMWNTIYNGINRANQIIDKAPGITDPNFTDKDAVIGQAYFLRAYHHFNLLRYWGGVPIKTTATDTYVPEEIVKPRNTPAEVYTQILADLAEAEARLPLAVSAVSNKSRVHYKSVQALKARVHLYRGDWSAAITAATEASAGYSLVTNFQNLWDTKNSAESIFEIQFESTDQNGTNFFLLPTVNGGRNECRPASGLVGAYAANDTRRILATSIDARLKYYRASTDDDNVIVFRLAEMLLIRAEALANRNTGTDLLDAVTLINQLRNRATIGNYLGALDQASVLNEIFLQRRLELALEGHYFFDLVRTGRAAANLTSPAWDNNMALLPIPLREINASGGVLAQNPGY